MLIRKLTSSDLHGKLNVLKNYKASKYQKISKMKNYDPIYTGQCSTLAMRLLYDLTKQMDAKTGFPLELWIKKNDLRTKEKFQYLKEENSFTGPVPFMQESENTKFKVTIDPGQQFNIVDKLSQVNCIQQLENIAAYPFAKERLSQKDLLLHAFWYDIHSGNVFLLSRERQRLVEVNERSYFGLMQEVKNRASAKILSES